jgi:phosphoribosylanthranilate isomerase
MKPVTRTRIKICGITTPEDGVMAAGLGADAIGLVFWQPSVRSLTHARARDISRALPPLVARVALFVDPSEREVAAAIEACHPDLLQFHGVEPPEFCRAFGIRYVKAAHVRAELDLLEYLSPYHDAAGWLLDAYSAELPGGTGETFNWALIPGEMTRPVILSGGLSPANVSEAIRIAQPWAVDVSSGVEAAKGIKDPQRIAAFVAGVRNADERAAR